MSRLEPEFSALVATQAIQETNLNIKSSCPTAEILRLQ